MNRCVIALIIAGAVFGACRKSPPPPETPQPSGEQITGKERLGWTQAATDPTELAGFKYAIYVDGARSPLANVSCSTTPSQAGFDCSAPLPAMSPGPHVLQLAAYVNDATPLESSRSAPLDVIVAPGAATTSHASPPGDDVRELQFSTEDGIVLHVTVLARGLDEPTDIAAAGGGRFFIAERRGRIRVFYDGALHPPSAAPLPDVATDGQGGLLAIAIDRRFDATHFLYTVFTTKGRHGDSSFALARFRESHDTVADRAILLDEVPAAARPSASLRFGADGKLYVAFDDGGQPASAGDMASFSGKLLRIDADGTTPDDQAAGTPVWSLEYRSPRGFDWQPASGSIWIVDTTANGSAQLSAIASGGGGRRRGMSVATYLLAGLPGASGAAFYRSNVIHGFHGNLLVASNEGRHILRVRFDARDPTRVAGTERLLQDAIGGIRAIAAAPDGAVYVCTSHTFAKIAPPE